MSDPSATAMRRVLARGRDGKPLDQDEATLLLQARGDDLERLKQFAARVRDAGLQAAKRPGIITYSKKVFIPLTRLCRDRCGYCTFATVPGRLDDAYLSPDEVLDIAARGAELGCKEALFTLGDRPERRWKQAQDWLDAHGYDDTLSYVRAMAIAVLERTGLLPHLNPGVMSWQDFQRLKPVAPSMGMMLAGQRPERQDPCTRRRWPFGRPFYHRNPDRHRRDPGRARRFHLRHPQGRPRVQRHPGSDRAELPRQTGHEDARGTGRRT
jgi:FO synthase